jgi:hypothetical protein
VEHNTSFGINCQKVSTPEVFSIRTESTYPTLQNTPISPYTQKCDFTVRAQQRFFFGESWKYKLKNGNICGHANWPKERRRVKNIGTRI